MALSTSLLSYYKLDETTGNPADSVGSNTLTNINTTLFGSALIGNGAIQDASSNKRFTRSDALGLNLNNSFSVSLWVKANIDIASADWGVFTIADTTRNASIRMYYSYNSGSRLLYFQRSRVGSAFDGFTTSLTMGTSSFHHLVATFDGSTIKGYVDGVLVGSTPSSGSGVGPTVNFTTLGAGVNESTGAEASFGNFTIDEVGIWTKELGADEVIKLYNAGLGTQYPFPPNVTTQAVSGIDFTTATGNGTVVSDNDAVITERGIVWSTTATPTVANFKGTATGTTGAFSVPMTGLSINTTYYVRAYAISASGTSYGAQVSFTTSNVDADTLALDIGASDGDVYAFSVNVGGSTGFVTVSLGSTGTSQSFNAGTGVNVFQGTYGGDNGITIVASAAFNGYVDDVMYVLVVGDSTIDWSLDSLTNIFPINSTVLFKRLEDKDFDRFRIYRYLDIQFKDLDAYVTVLLKKEANEDASDSTKQFLVDNVSGEVLPFINKRVSILTKNYGMRIALSNNRLNETFTICQLVISGMDTPRKTFSSSKIISVS